ncbi:MAG: hypothetical protein ABEK59_12280 [Halobacteria archaeon]
MTKTSQQKLDEGAPHEDIKGEWELVRSWSSFSEFFEDAVHVDAVTYCESPGLIVDMFDGSEEINCGLESMDILIGDKVDYRERLEDVETAKRLADLYQEDRLKVMLSKRREVHSKLYRIEKPDKVVLLNGSANLSYTAWSNQSNSFTVWYTRKGTGIDEKFMEHIEEHLGSYSYEVFLREFTEEQLSTASDDEEVEKRLQLWIDNEMSELNDRAKIHTDVEDELDELAVAVDETIKLSEGKDEEEKKIDEDDEGVGLPDANLSIENRGGSETDGDLNMGDDVSVSGSDSGVGEKGSMNSNNRGNGKPLISGAEADTVITEGYSLTLPTETLSDGKYGSSLAKEFQKRGGTRSHTGVEAPVAAYSEFYQTEYDEELMYLRPEENAIHVQCGEKHKQVVADEPADMKALDKCLEHLERYITTVDRWGYNTTTQTAVKAHMYEAILFGMWAPFVNLYAEVLDGPATRLDNDLPYLYISGRSDAGKDILTEFIVRLITDGLVTEGGADADKIGTKDIRRLRDINTPFPFIINDIEKSKIESYSSLRNFWKEWRPSQDVSYPTIIFTSNDTRPKDWFRNRARMLHFDVVFPSNSEEESYYDAKEDLEEILCQHNPIFRFVSRRLFESERYKDGDGTVDHIREIMMDIYSDVGRELPEYFPEKPASRIYNVGKRKWNNAVKRGDIVFEEQSDYLVAQFDADSSEVYSFRKTLDPKCKPDKYGSKITIQNPEYFKEWIDVDIEQSSSWIKSILGLE